MPIIVRSVQHMDSWQEFQGKDPMGRALFIIDHYADIFFGNLGFQLKRREIKDIMAVAEEVCRKELNFDGLMRILRFLDETYHSDHRLEMECYGPLATMPIPKALDAIERLAEESFQADDLPRAMIYYQMLDRHRPGEKVTERMLECVRRIA